MKLKQGAMRGTIRKSGCLSRDLMDVLYVTSRAFECRQADELRKQVLDLLQPIFGADSSNFFLASSEEDRISFRRVVSNGIEEKWISDFRQHYHRYDPFVKTLFHCTAACTTEQVIPYEKLVKTCYYNDFLKPQSIHSQLTLYLRSGRRLVGIIALFRPKSREVFSEDDREKAGMMTPYLTGALEMSIAVERDAKNQAILGAISSEITHEGVVILNERCEIVYANDAAREIMFVLCGGRKYAGANVLSLPDGLSRRLFDCLGCEGSSEGFDLFAKETKQRVSVVVSQQAFAGKPLYKLILRPEEESLCLSRKLAEIGLTARQSEVVSLVSSGFSNSEISDKLCISQYTVENHLRLIYEKLNVRNRTSLTRLVFSLTRRFPLNAPSGA